MLLLKDALAFELDHSPTCMLRGAPAQSLVVAASRNGHISLCGLEPETTISRLTAPRKIGAICPHPAKPLLALTEGGTGKLLILRFDGSVVFEDAAPRLPGGSPDWATAGYMDCCFDESGSYLWCAANTPDRKVQVELRETHSWSLVSRGVVEPASNDGGAYFMPTPRPETLALWLPAGPDRCVYWVTRDGGNVRCTIEPRLKNSGPPTFSPSGREFLVIDHTVRKFGYPAVKLLGVCQSPYVDYDDPFSDHVCYLDETRALATFFSGRIAVLDALTLRVVDELVIEGNKQLRSYFERVGDFIVFVYPLHHPLELKSEDWKYGLLCFPVHYVLDQYRSLQLELFGSDLPRSTF